MAFNSERTMAKRFPGTDHQRMALQEAIDAPEHHADAGAEPTHHDPWRMDIVRALNEALAAELRCALRYERHCFIADGLARPKIAQEFLGYANEEWVHADQLARRIVQLGGKPDVSPHSIIQGGHPSHDDSLDLKAMVRANLIAEGEVIDCYCRILVLIRDRDLTTRRLVEDILIDEMDHAEELRDWDTD